MTPKEGLPGAIEAANRPALALRSSSTIGDSGESRRRSSSSETVHASSIASRDGAISAKGFSSRCFRLRSRTTADSSARPRSVENRQDPSEREYFPSERDPPPASTPDRRERGRVRRRPRIQAVGRNAGRRSVGHETCGLADHGIRDRIGDTSRISSLRCWVCRRAGPR